MRKRVAIVILSWNSASESIRLYNEIGNYLDNQAIDLLRLVVDNNSADSDRDMLKEQIISNDLLMNEVNSGYAGGNNLGIKKVLERGADYICILNPDIQINSDFISPLLQQLDEDQSIGVIGPRICYRDATETIYSDGGILDVQNFFKVIHINNKLKQSSCLQQVRLVDYVNGSAMVIPKKSFLSNGLFREDFFMYFEETEWCMRLRQTTGLRIMVDSRQTVFHKSSNRGFKFHFYINRNRLWLAKMYNDKRLYVRTRNKYLIKYVKSLVKMKAFSWYKLKGTLHGALLNPSNYSG